MNKGDEPPAAGMVPDTPSRASYPIGVLSPLPLNNRFRWNVSERHSAVGAGFGIAYVRTDCQLRTMTSKRHFNGLAHDIAHHAQSGLGWMHPHVGRACRLGGVKEVGLNLLSDDPWPPSFPVDEPLRLATATLQQKFREMVEGAGLEVGDLAAAILSFHPVTKGDDYSTEVRSRLTTTDGRTFAHTLAISW